MTSVRTDGHSPGSVRASPRGLARVGVRLDDYSAGALGEDGLDRLSEDRRSRHARRERHDHRRCAHVLGFLDDRLPAWPARTFSQCPETRLPPWSLACSMVDSAAASASGIAASIVSALGTVIVTSRWIAASAGRELDRGGECLLVEDVVGDVQNTESYSASWSTTGCVIATLCVEVEIQALPAPVDPVQDEAEGEPGGAGGGDVGVQDDRREERQCRGCSTHDGEQRDVGAADGHVPWAAVGARQIGLADAQADDGQMRDRE